MRRLLLSIALLLAAFSASCDSEPAAPGLYDVAAVYGFGSLRLVSGGDTTDITSTTYGAVILAPDHATLGLLLVEGFMEGPEGGTVPVDGTWELDGRTITLEHDPETFLDGIPLEYDDGRLIGEAAVDGGRLLIELEKAEPDEAIGR